MTSITMDALRSINIFQEKTMSDESLLALAELLGWNTTNQKLTMLASNPTRGATIVYWLCGVFLCLDTLIRMIFCPRKCSYFKSILNVAETLHLICFILIRAIFANSDINVAAGDVMWAWTCLHAILSLKVAKVFRLGLNIPSFKLMYVSLLSSYRELSFLFMLVLTFTAILGPVLFLVEYSSDGNIEDMFTSFWWAIITMTTVGYGDYYPVTFGGRVVGALCAVIGVLTLAMPIGILASSFSGKHFNYQLVNTHCKRRKLKAEPLISLTWCIQPHKHLPIFDRLNQLDETILK